MGVSKLGSMDLIFIDAGVKINDTYYHEVLLTQKLLPVMREICGEFFIFQQGNVPASCLPSTPDIHNQLSETRHLRSFRQTFGLPTAQI